MIVVHKIDVYGGWRHDPKYDFWVIAVDFIIYGIVLFKMKQATKKEISSPVEEREDSSTEILCDRFMREEIDEQEYEKRNEFLQNKK